MTLLALGHPTPVGAMTDEVTRGAGRSCGAAPVYSVAAATTAGAGGSVRAVLCNVVRPTTCITNDGLTALVVGRPTGPGGLGGRGHEGGRGLRVFQFG